MLTPYYQCFVAVVWSSATFLPNPQKQAQPIMPPTTLTTTLTLYEPKAQQMNKRISGRNARTADLGCLDLILGVVPLDCHRPRGVLEVLRVVLLQPLPYALLRGSGNQAMNEQHRMRIVGWLDIAIRSVILSRGDGTPGSNQVIVSAGSSFPAFHTPGKDCGKGLPKK